jgi:hypothetical protein
MKYCGATLPGANNPLLQTTNVPNRSQLIGPDSNITLAQLLGAENASGQLQ